MSGDKRCGLIRVADERSGIQKVQGTKGRLQKFRKKRSGCKRHIHGGELCRNCVKLVISVRLTSVPGTSAIYERSREGSIGTNRNHLFLAGQFLEKSKYISSAVGTYILVKQGQVYDF